MKKNEIAVHELIHEREHHHQRNLHHRSEEEHQGTGGGMGVEKAEPPLAQPERRWSRNSQWPRACRSHGQARNEGSARTEGGARMAWRGKRWRVERNAGLWEGGEGENNHRRRDQAE